MANRGAWEQTEEGLRCHVIQKYLIDDGEAVKNFGQKSVIIKTLLKKQSADRLAWGKAVAKRIIEENYCNSSDEWYER